MLDHGFLLLVSVRVDLVFSEWKEVRQCTGGIIV